MLWPGSTPFQATVEIDHATHGGYTRSLSLREHAGTHLDAPVHFAEGGAAADELPLTLLVRPAVRLDVRELVAGDPTFTLGADQIEAIEAKEGAIPGGCAVLVHTGWDVRLAEPSSVRRHG